MPTKTGKTYNTFYGNDLSVNQSSNTGVDATTREVQDGFGNNTVIKISDDELHVKGQNDDTTAAFKVSTKNGTVVFHVDTANHDVKAGDNNTNVLTLEKEMGLYEFSPTSQGYHYPLIANKVGMAGAESFTADDDWGNATDPPTTLDVSGLTNPENAIAVYWFAEEDIELDRVRFVAICDGEETLNFHLFAYDFSTSAGTYGDLSNGAVHASGTVDTVASGIKTGSLTINSPVIENNKVIIGFVENSTSTDDFSVIFNIRYHIV